jgi:pyrroloquinoline quinone biosynthesis protein B
MRVKILGSAAGGAFPQWNCCCANCRRWREGKFKGTARTQAQLAWTSAPGQWTLLNASPDLRFQIEATRELWPQEGTRHSPIRDVIVSSAEVDQTLGLLLLREFHSFRIYATPSIRRILTEDNSIFGVLARFAGQVCWNDIPLEQAFSAGGARLEVLPLSGSFPGFVSPSRLAELNPAEAVIGLLISPEVGGGTLAFLPGAACVSEALLERLQPVRLCSLTERFGATTNPQVFRGSPARPGKWDTCLSPGPEGAWNAWRHSRGRAGFTSTLTTPIRFWMKRA